MIEAILNVFAVIGVLGVAFWVYVGVTSLQDSRKERRHFR